MFKIRKSDIFFASLLACLAAALQLVNINKWSFWFDESFSDMLTRFSFWEIPYRTAIDVHPPLYYLVLKTWAWLFGYGDVAMRALSILFMSMAVGLVYILVLRLYNNSKAAFLAGLLAAIGPYVMRYGQEARMYAMQNLTLVALSYVFVLLIEVKFKDRRLNLMYSLLLAAALLTHNFGGLIFIVHILYFMMISKGPLWGRLPKIYKKDLKRAFLIYLIWLPVLIFQFVMVESGFWIGDVNLWTAANTVSQTISYSNLNGSLSGWQLALVWVATLALGVVLTATGYKAYKQRQTNNNFLALTVLVGPLVIVSGGLFVYSVLPFTDSLYTFRYLSQFAVLFYAGVGVAVYQLFKKQRLAAGLATMVIVSSMVFGLTRAYDGQGGSNGDGRPQEVNKQVTEIIEASAGDTPFVIRTVEYYDYYNYAHYNYENTLLRDNANLNGGGAVLVRNRGDEIYFTNNYARQNPELVFVIYKQVYEDDRKDLEAAGFKKQETIAQEVGEHGYFIDRYSSKL